MAVQEIDEVELMRLRKQDATVHALMANPKSKRKIFEAYKEHDPNARIPELEMEAAARQPVEALEKTVSDLQKQIADDKAEREKSAKLASLSGTIDEAKRRYKQAGWFAEDIEKVEKLMEEKGTTDFDLAAAYYEKMNPPQQVATPRGTGGWNFVDQVQDGEADLKKLIETRGASETLADKMARDALNEIRGAAARR